MGIDHDPAVFRCAEVLSDGEWLAHRRWLTQALQGTHSAVSFSNCKWMDLHPLTDLLAQLAAFLLRGGSLVVSFDTKNPDVARTTRFLLESGFLDVLTARSDCGPGSTVCLLDGDSLTMKEGLAVIKTLRLPPRLLDYESLVPCQLVNVSEWGNREKVYKICQGYRERAMGSDRTRALRISTALVHQAKFFFNVVLPELLDNARLHKGPDTEFSGLVALFVRIRRQADRIRLLESVPESGLHEAPLDRLTWHYWEHDILEASLADLGEGILGSWMRRWEALPDRGSVPKLNSRQRSRLDGHNADGLILKAVFEGNESSLPPSDRRDQGLPAISGLHSIRRTMQVANYGLGIRSGRSYFAVASAPLLDNSPGEFEPILSGPHRVQAGLGVQVLFRCAAASGRRTQEWYDGFPAGGLENSPEWWRSQYPSRFGRALVINEHKLPAESQEGDVVLCRANHPKTKAELLSFVRLARKRGANLVFVDLPGSVALQLQSALRLLSADLPEMAIPIVTDDLRVFIAGAKYQRSASRSFCEGGRSGDGYWWSREDSSIRSLCDAFARCRQHDSSLFWNAVRTLEGAFTPEEILWDKNTTLCLGFLSLEVAGVARPLRKLLRRRLTSLAQHLRVGEVQASDERLLYWAQATRRDADLRDDEFHDRTLILGGVLVHGRGLASAIRNLGPEKHGVPIPMLIYPSFGLRTTRELDGKRDEAPRAFDWDRSSDGGSDQNLRQSSPRVFRRRQPDEIGVFAERALVAADENLERTALAWQRHEVAWLGHCAYGRHHFLYWLDLFKFITESSSECQEMLQHFVKQVADKAPDWILYVPHEVTHIFLERLRQHADEMGYGEVWAQAKLWPANELGLFEAVHGESVRQAKSRPSAVVLDDALVTGATIRETARRLRDFGFSAVHTFVILNRMPGQAAAIESLVSGDSIESWWAIESPPIGDRRTCRLCTALERLRNLPGLGRETFLSRQVSTLVQPWECFSQSGQPKVLAEGWIENSTWAGLGSGRLIGGSDAVEAFMDYHHRVTSNSWQLFDETKETISSEVIAGLVMRGLQELTEDERERALLILTSRVWGESRLEARGLLLLSIASLDSAALARLEYLLGECVRRTGTHNIDIATTAACTTLLAQRSPKVALEVAGGWVKSSPQDDQVLRDAHSQALGFLRLLLHSAGDAQVQRMALTTLGIPGRGSVHVPFLPAMRKLRASPSAVWRNRDERRALELFLDAVEGGAREIRGRLEGEEVAASVDELFRQWRRVRDSAGREDPTPELAARSLELFWVGSVGRPSVRSILAAEQLHYLPLFVRRAVRYLVDRESGWSSDDFQVAGKPSRMEDELIESRSTSGVRNLRLLESLREAEHVIADRMVLELLVVDVLSDARHPKGAGLGLAATGKQPFMKVTFQGSDLDGSVGVEFTNRLVGEVAPTGLSWRLVTDRMSEMGGEATQFIARGGFLVRKLRFSRFLRASAAKAKR